MSTEITGGSAAPDPSSSLDNPPLADFEARWPKMVARARVAADGGGIACHVEAHELVQELVRLRRWKGEALQVLNDWHAAWKDVDCPGELGTAIAQGMAAEIKHLRRTLVDRDEWCEHLVQRESALLVAVPRPFRSLVARRADRIREGSN